MMNHEADGVENTALTSGLVPHTNAPFHHFQIEVRLCIPINEAISAGTLTRMSCCLQIIQWKIMILM